MLDMFLFCYLYRMFIPTCYFAKFSLMLINKTYNFR